MTEMIQPLRKLIDIKRYKGSNKFIWTDEGIEAFNFFYVAVSNCQDLYFFDDTTTPILQTDAYLTMVLVATYMVMSSKDKSESYDSSASPSQDHNWIGLRERNNYMEYTMA